jgi:hypothetical protein
MFTSVSLNPKAVALFVADSVSRADKDAITQGRSLDPNAGDYAIELVTDLQQQLTDLCSLGKIDDLSDDNAVDFRLRSDGILWSGSVWVTVYDDLPGCPTEVNCSICYYSEETTHETLIGTMPEERYETFPLDVLTAYSRSDVQSIRLEANAARVDAYVTGYASGQEFERTTNG